MLRKIISLSLLLLVSGSTFATEVTYKSGQINLIKIQEEGAPDIFTLPLGKMVTGKLNLFHEEKGGKQLVNGNAEFKNASNKDVYLVYYLSLKDKKGRLVAATSGDLQVGQTGNIHQYVSALMPLPSSEFENISYYEIVLYESEKPIGTS